MDNFHNSFPPKGDIYLPSNFNIYDHLDSNLESNSLSQIVTNQNNEILELKEINKKLKTEVENYKKSSKKNTIITWITWGITTSIAIAGLIVAIFSYLGVIANG